jgi:hypothetical protein
MSSVTDAADRFVIVFVAAADVIAVFDDVSLLQQS